MGEVGGRCHLSFSHSDRDWRVNGSFSVHRKLWERTWGVLQTCPSVLPIILTVYPSFIRRPRGWRVKVHVLWSCPDSPHGEPGRMMLQHELLHPSLLCHIICSTYLVLMQKVLHCWPGQAFSFQWTKFELDPFSCSNRSSEHSRQQPLLLIWSTVPTYQAHQYRTLRYCSAGALGPPTEAASVHDSVYNQSKGGRGASSSSLTVTRKICPAGW